MSYVLTTKSTITCGHGGQVQVESVAKLRVNGAPVLTQSSIKGKIILNCQTLLSDKSKPCDTVTADPPPAITAGWSKKLFVGGQPVMLDTLAGQTSGTVGGVTPQGLLKGVAGQAKLSTE